MTGAMDDPASLAREATGALRQGDNPRAISLADRATRLDPHSFNAWTVLAHARAQSGDLRAAIDALEHAARLRPHDARTGLDLGAALVRTGRLARAREVLSAVIDRAPSAHATLVQLMHAMMDLDLKSLARTCAERALEIEPRDASTWTVLWSLLMADHEWDEAWSCLDRAIASVPGDAKILSARARHLERTNQLDDAESEARRALDADPNEHQARLVLARLEARRGDPDQAESHLRALLGSSPSPATEVEASVELARALDSKGRHAEAFDLVTRAKASWLAQPRAQGYPRQAMPARIDAAGAIDWNSLARAWDSEHRSDRPAPVFLVGFPRSGTTLAEQLLDAHPQLATIDESGLVLDMTVQISRWSPGGRGYPAGLSKLSCEQLAELERRYFASADARLGDRASRDVRILDKMPMNIVLIPAIRRVFPDARVIVALRDPRDCCLSCLFQLFRPNRATVHMTTLESTASLYAQVMGLWLELRSMPGLEWLEARYEDLTRDPEAWIQRACAFLGLDPEQTTRNTARGTARSRIQTPSYRDVAAPVTAKAVGRWRRHEERFANVSDVLQPYIDAFGYSDDHSQSDP